MMNLRQALGTLALAAAGLAGVGAAGGLAQNTKSQDHKTHSTPPAARTIAECMLSCEQMARHCVQRLGEGKKDHLNSSLALADCAEICSTTATLVARSSQFATKQLDSCAAACDTCATECDKIDEASMKQCAQICRDTARACRGSTKPDNPKPADGGKR